jgi:hypothetical protein
MTIFWPAMGGIVRSSFVKHSQAGVAAGRYIDIFYESDFH